MSYVAACGVLCALAVLAVADAGRDAVAATTTIEGTDVHWEFSDSKGNDYAWSMPVVAFEDIVVESRNLVRDKVKLQLDDETIRTVNFDGFVRGDFVNVIGGVYDNSHDNSDFIWEVWYIVSQLTVYDKDLHEYSEGRYALETLTRGGGDCEDLVILVADMLMSSPHTDDWTFEYVYMDADNPTDPQTMNHVILVVNDGEHDYFIEATAPPSWDYYPERVTGWRFDVVPYTGALDFTGADLAWLDLSRKNLNGAVMVGADIRGAYLFGTDLSGANLTLANLEGAYLYGADLNGAVLVGANLNGAVLVGANLGGVDLSGSYLADAGLFGAVMDEAVLVGSDLSGADLRGAYLSGADLSRSYLGEANLRGADLGEANLEYADLVEANLVGADISGAYLVYADLEGAFLFGANLDGAALHGSDLSGASLFGANLNEAILARADLSDADLRGAYLGGADLSGANLAGTNLHNTITDSRTIMP